MSLKNVIHNKPTKLARKFIRCDICRKKGIDLHIEATFKGMLPSWQRTVNYYIHRACGSKEVDVNDIPKDNKVMSFYANRDKLLPNKDEYQD